VRELLRLLVSCLAFALRRKGVLADCVLVQPVLPIPAAAPENKTSDDEPAHGNEEE
jgi:hypothetical protein